MQIDVLRQVPLFSNLPESQLQWLAEQGKEIWLEPGALIAQQGDPPDGFYVILAGQTEWTRTLDGETVPAVVLQAGDVFAELILLLDEPYPTSGRAVTAVQLYKLTPDAFWDMLNCCRDLVRSILKISMQRSQIHETVTQQQAKLISLGTLSAGLAHELNNPAAAVKRNVQNLDAILQQLPKLALKLHASALADPQMSFLAGLYEQAAIAARQHVCLDPLTQSEAEDAVSDWLEDHQIENGWKLAPMFVTAGFDSDRLEEITTHIEPKCLGDVLTWLEATLTGAKLIDEIKLSSTRISELIQAMKDYSYRDQAPLQEIDVHEGIESTLTILKHKLKGGVVVKRQYNHELPHISAHGRELNQVWTNLIDNAIDAMQGKGELTIRTQQDHNQVVVEITDTGSGIPAEVRSRIFEPFFTTKAVGAGTGLGLDIVRRIVVQRHHGEIQFKSQPGSTYFRVRLPIAQAESA